MTGREIKKSLKLGLRENTSVFEGELGVLPLRIILVHNTYNRRLKESQVQSFNVPELTNKGELSRLHKYEPMLTFILYEAKLGKGFTITDFQRNALSKITRKYYDTINISSQELKRVYWDKSRKTLNIVIWNNKGEEKSSVTMKGKVRKKEYYRVVIRFEKVKEKPETVGDLEKIFNENTALVHSSDPSWLYQGMWKLASELNYAVHPFPSEYDDTGKQREKHMKGHDSPYVSKHIIAAIDYLKQHAKEVLEKLK